MHHLFGKLQKYGSFGEWQCWCYDHYHYVELEGQAKSLGMD